MPQATEIRDWTIYKITSPSGRIYIGVTCNFSSRMERYRNLHKRPLNKSIIHSSIIKHGFENHVVEKVESFKSDKDYAFGKEMFWIRSYMSNIHRWREQNGMNMTDGGEGTVGHKHTEEQRLANKERMVGFKHSEESKKKISESKKGVPRLKVRGMKYKISEDERKRRAESARENKKKWSHKHTEETKKKMSATQSARDFSYQIGRKMPEWFGEFVSQRNKGNKYGLGRVKSADEIKRLSESKFKPVIAFDLNMQFVCEYKSVNEAAKNLTVCPSSVSTAIKRNRPTNGYFIKLKNAS